MMERTTNILIADPQPVFRAGLKAVLSTLHHVHIQGEAVNYEELMIKLKVNRPDILIIDDHPDYLNGNLIKLLDTIQNCKLIVITKEPIIKKHKSIHCFLHKECGAEEIINAVNALSNGEPFLCKKEKGCPFCPMSNLTERELEIIKLIANDLSNKEIAEALHISPHTVHSHRKNILKKLNLNSASAVTAFAHRAGLV